MFIKKCIVGPDTKEHVYVLSMTRPKTLYRSTLGTIGVKFNIIYDGLKGGFPDPVKYKGGYHIVS